MDGRYVVVFMVVCRWVSRYLCIGGDVLWLICGVLHVVIVVSGVRVDVGTVFTGVAVGSMLLANVVVSLVFGPVFGMSAGGVIMMLVITLGFV